MGWDPPSPSPTLQRNPWFFEGRPTDQYLAFPGVGIGVGLTNGLLIGVWLDGKLGLAERNEARRARAAREVAVKLGPTFIKLGQALSIRCGLVSCPALSQARGDTPGGNSTPRGGSVVGVISCDSVCTWKGHKNATRRLQVYFFTRFHGDYKFVQTSWVVSIAPHY